MADIIGLNGDKVKPVPVAHNFTFTFHNIKDAEPIGPVTVPGFLSLSGLFVAIVDSDDMVQFVANTADVAHVAKGAPVQAAGAIN